MNFSASTNRPATLPHENGSVGHVSVTSKRPLGGQLDFGNYWNTTQIAGDDLVARRQRAAAQDAAVLALYRTHRQLSPWQAWELLGKQWPITSIRRAVNTLTGRKALVKLDTYRMGPEGAREHLWGIA